MLPALRAGLIAAALALVSLPAPAQDVWPSKAVTIIVGFPPGTATDAMARLIAERLAPRFGQQFVIDNRPGVGGSLGAGIAAKAKPDGYTLLVSASAPMAINPHIYAKLSYDPLKDFTPIGLCTWLPYSLVTRPDYPANSLQELVAMARKAPDTVTYGSTGNGTTSHLVMAVIGARENVVFRHVPYKGSAQAQADVVGGQVDVTFDTQLSSLGLVQSGRLKPLAVSTATRTQALPKVGTVAEQGLPDFDLGAWLGLFGPAGMPAPIQDALANALQQILKEPDFIAKVNQIGAEVRSSASPAAFAEFVKKDNEQWGRIVHQFNVKANE